MTRQLHPGAQLAQAKGGGGAKQGRRPREVGLQASAGASRERPCRVLCVLVTGRHRGLHQWEGITQFSFLHLTLVS